MKIHHSKFVCGATHPKHYPAPDRPEIAFAGRSNAGKSSLLNTLLGRKRLARVSKTPGRTREINFFDINDHYHVVDLPGYGYAQVSKSARRAWGPMMESYLRDRETLVGVIVLMDIRHPPRREDEQLIDALINFERYVIPVATKCDKLSKSKIFPQQTLIAKALGIDKDAVLPFSSVTGQGRDELWRRITSILPPTSESTASTTDPSSETTP